MNFLEPILLAIHVLVALSICVLVLLQHGKGADMGAAFGSGSSGSLFGAVGSANFLSRSTAVFATLFFATSLGLTYLGSMRAPSSGVDRSIMDQAVPKAGDVPGIPAPAQPSGTAPPQGGRSGEVPK